MRVVHIPRLFADIFCHSPFDFIFGWDIPGFQRCASRSSGNNDHTSSIWRTNSIPHTNSCPPRMRLPT